MKAAVMRAQDAPLEIEDIEIDEPAAGEVLIKTAASGICHSDLHIMVGDIPIPPPCVLGHEPAGIVEKVGAGVIDFAEGDHVIGCATPWCGVCKFCTAGRPYLCLSQFEPRDPALGPRLSKAGEAIGQFVNLASFAEKMLCPELSNGPWARPDHPSKMWCASASISTTGMIFRRWRRSLATICVTFVRPTPP